VVDDDPEIRQFIRIKCENAVGYYVWEAGDCAQAINELTRDNESTSNIDAIITDFAMPQLNGVGAITYFQKECPGIPLIVLSGIADWEMAISLIGGGVNNDLVKPIEGEQCKASVAGGIRHRQLTWTELGCGRTRLRDSHDVCVA